jgi:AAA15 family ATPase/GTPase
MYKSIHLNSEVTKSYNITSRNRELKNLSKINILIGPNNSGKSKFLREIFYDLNLEYKLESVDLFIINDAILKLQKDIRHYYNAANIFPIEGFDLNNLNKIEYLSYKTDLRGLYEWVYKLLTSPVNMVTPKSTPSSVTAQDVNAYISMVTSTCLEKISSLKDFDNHAIKYEHYYIPTLRGLRGINYHQEKIASGDNYRQRTKEDYFRSLTAGKEIYTGLSLYEDVKKLLLGSSSDRKKIREFEQFISGTFFDNQEFSIIPSISDNVVHIKIGDEEDRPIYYLGDGIQSIIILTYPLFFNQGKKICVFYEEPDLYLHPGFQRIFIETLNKFPEFQFFMTTHSNHFLDMTLDFNSISVYTFKKNEKKEFFIENVKNDDLNILELLGVKNSAVFLSNCTIWVEGITDRIYLRKFLELYKDTSGKVFLEDIHYSFVEYGGGNITHWSFLEDSDEDHSNIDVEKLCGKLFLISDKDGAGIKKDGSKSKKVLRQENLEARLGDRYYCLKAREIENTLSEQIVIDAIKEIEGENSVNLDFSKIVQSKYENQLLGKFINEKIVALSKSYAAESGTIKDKVEFAKISVSHMKKYDDLTDEAKLLTEKIYKFIQINNPK